MPKGLIVRTVNERGTLKEKHSRLVELVKANAIFYYQLPFQFSRSGDPGSSSGANLIKLVSLSLHKKLKWLCLALFFSLF
jgi:hypothetical protein